MKYTLQIQDPCHQDWNKMARTEKGKYWAVCEKEVHDFTKLTNNQIAKILGNSQGICGRLKKEQLNVTLNTKKGTRFSKAKLLVGFTALLGITTPVFAQGEPIKTEQVSVAKPFVSIFKDKKEHKAKLIKVKGIVFDEMGPVADITVKLKNAKLSTITDFDGQFELELTESQFKEGILEILHVSYNKKEIILKDRKEIIKVNIEGAGMKLKVTIIAGGIGFKRQNIFQRVGNLFKKKSCKK